LRSSPTTVNAFALRQATLTILSKLPKKTAECGSNPEYAAFLSLLRRVRMEAGLSQVELAEPLQETQSFVSKCERGERRIDIIELRLFCSALGVTLTEFSAQLEQELKVVATPK